MNTHRSAAGRGAIAALVVLLAALLAASPASAVTGHRPTTPFGTTDPGKLQAVSPGGVTTTRAANGSVYVADSSAGVVQEYAQSGDNVGTISLADQVASPTAIARDPASGDLYIAGSDPVDFTRKVARYSPSTGQWKQPLNLSLIPVPNFSIDSLTVDSGGRVYVGANNVSDADFNSLSPRVYLIAANNTQLVRTITNGATPFTKVGLLSVDSADTLYVTDVGVAVRKYSGTTGNAAGTAGNATDIPYAAAVDAVGNDVYIVDTPDNARCGITRYSSANARQERFDEGPCPDAFGSPTQFAALSVDANSDIFFAGNQLTPAVDRFVTFTAPTVSTNAASAVAATTATASGSVNNNGQANTRYQFQYGTDSTYDGNTTFGGVTTEQPVTTNGTKTETLEGLKPRTTYHYRLKATNNLGTNYGQDRTFTTLGAAPTVTGEAATNVTAFTATLNATVVANNEDAKAHFEYGPASGGYPNRVPTDAANDTSVGAGLDPFPLTANIDGLDPEVTYHFRVVAENGTGTTTTPGTEFTTKPAPPLASPGPVSGVAGGTARFSGTVDTQGLEGTVSFVVSATNSPYQGVTAPQYLAPADGARAVSGSISGLPAGGVFEVRTRVQTSTRTVLSQPVTFSTATLATSPPVTAPVISSPLPTTCVVPRLAAPSRTLRAGKAVTLTGTDLGTSGSVRFGSRTGRVEQYSPTRISVVVPSQAKGKTPITVTCGNVSNTVAATVDAASKPSNSYRLSTSTKGQRATVKLKVPGRGKVLVKGAGIGTKTASPKKAGTLSVKVGLTKSARAKLSKAKSKRLSVKIEVRYHPTGGSTRKAERTLVFRR